MTPRHVATGGSHPDTTSGVRSRNISFPPFVRVTADGPIGADHFRNLDVDAKAVLIRTDWCKRWGRDYFRSGPYLTAAACRVLVEAGAALAGIDCANIDSMADPARPAHTILLAASIPNPIPKNDASKMKLLK